MVKQATKAREGQCHLLASPCGERPRRDGRETQTITVRRIGLPLYQSAAPVAAISQEEDAPTFCPWMDEVDNLSHGKVVTGP